MTPLEIAAIELVAATRAYWKNLDDTRDWPQERKQYEIDNNPEGWFGPWERMRAAQISLAAEVDKHGI